MKLKSGENMFVVGGIAVIAILIVFIVLLVGINKKEKSVSDLPIQMSLDGKLATDGRYQDEVCGISFNYPKTWLKSDIKLPLSQEPLSYVVFNEPAKGNLSPKNSIFFFICYDVKKYSFDQFIAQSRLSQGQTGVFDIGSVRWQRMGNFIYTTKGDKLLIFEMFFTKHDLKPEPGYEKVFLDIVKSVKFF